MNETSKSIPRRVRDPNFLNRYFVGHGVDLGSGDDWLGLYAEFFPLLERVDPFDITIDPAQDAQTVATLPRGTYDFVHSSHCLEHLVDPWAAVVAWLLLLKPGGHLIILVPDEDMYERGLWPSHGNADHKHSFSLYKTDGWRRFDSVTVKGLVCDLAPAFGPALPPFELIKAERLTSSYRYELGLRDGADRPVDQTLSPVGECAIEYILRRMTAREAAAGGRFVGLRHQDIDARKESFIIMLFHVELALDPVLRLLGELRRQLPFAESVALNRSADDGQTAIQRSLSSHFTLRRPDFIARTIYRQPGLDFASKANLRAGVRVHPERNFLAKFEYGGRKTSRGSALLSVPLKGVRPSFSDIVPKGRRAGRIIDRKTVFRLGKFIYQRLGRGRNTDLIKLYVMVPSVPIPASLGFVVTGRAEVERRWAPNITGTVQALIAETFQTGRGGK